MLRNDWKFEFVARDLAEAAAVKLAYHEDRLAFWKSKKEEVWATIRREGIEVDEKIALQWRSPKSSDYARGAQVMVRNDLQNDLNEVLDKLARHTSLRDQYRGWRATLEANPEARLELDIEDWQFFFEQR